LTQEEIQLLPFHQTDIGSVATAGSASISGPVENRVYTLQASGDDIFGTADAFHYLYQPLSGDGEIIARLTSIDPSGTISDFVRAWVMILESLTADSR